jgi:hypothetical protein
MRSLIDSIVFYGLVKVKLLVSFCFTTRTYNQLHEFSQQQQQHQQQQQPQQQYTKYNIENIRNEMYENFIQNATFCLWSSYTTTLFYERCIYTNPSRCLCAISLQASIQLGLFLKRLSVQFGTLKCSVRQNRNSSQQTAYRIATASVAIYPQSTWCCAF